MSDADAGSGAQLNATLTDLSQRALDENWLDDPATFRQALSQLLATGVIETILDPPPAAAHPSRRFCDALADIAEVSVELAESVQIQAFTANTIRRNAGPELWGELSAGIRTGSTVVASCVSEEQSGSDMSAIALAAERDGADFRLTGHKAWAAHAPFADELIVYARTSAAGLGGITAFLVPAGAPGVRTGAPVVSVAGLAVPTSDITFDDVRVPARRVLGRIDRGARVANVLITQGRVGVAACALGLGTAAFDEALRYARSHVRFGRPILEHQGIGFALADMATELAAARALLYVACDSVDDDPDAAVTACAQAKVFATDVALRVTTGALQTLGAVAYRPDNRAERRFRQAKLLQLLQGTNEIQRVTVANRLVARPASTTSA
ncbi:acyl-CoA dehydrogenase family protein [Nocardia cyriacigeorgica]|uniref:acyl-CoA dehydrogenase family protein n=1 Tax=Nocardia cyriacigeorgica TaxID=135487 RepID=UPI0013D0C798|nr:acyl-CoA dehydrogenase [Nocardia cyriacigeorgica]NEW27216.1 acyl-CoA dehydrogenase [Nocardia cyriacigeorgica]